MVCFLVPHCDGYEELHLKMRHQHISHFLFICGLTAILLVTGLAVEDQQSGLCEVPILLHEMLGNTISVLILTNDSCEQISDTVYAFLLHISRKSVDSLSYRLH
jgi:hypothetical protein